MTVRKAESERSNAELVRTVEEGEHQRRRARTRTENRGGDIECRLSEAVSGAGNAEEQRRMGEKQRSGVEDE